MTDYSVKHFTSIAEIRRLLNRMQILSQGDAQCVEAVIKVRGFKPTKSTKGRDSIVKLSDRHDKIVTRLHLLDHITNLLTSYYEENDKIVQRLLRDIDVLRQSILRVSQDTIEHVDSYVKSAAPQQFLKDVEYITFALRKKFGSNVLEPQFATTTKDKDTVYVAYVVIKNLKQNGLKSTKIVSVTCIITAEALERYAVNTLNMIVAPTRLLSLGVGTYYSNATQAIEALTPVLGLKVAKPEALPKLNIKEAKFDRTYIRRVQLDTQKHRIRIFFNEKVTNEGQAKQQLTHLFAEMRRLVRLVNPELESKLRASPVKKIGKGFAFGFFFSTPVKYVDVDSTRLRIFINSLGVPDDDTGKDLAYIFGIGKDKTPDKLRMFIPRNKRKEGKYK